MTTGHVEPAPLIHSRAALLSTGDEVVLGQIQDTNARWLAQRLVDLGVSVSEHAAVPDDLEALVNAITRLARSAPLLIMTGGLGPTDGDLTRAALARVLQSELVVDATASEAIGAMLAKRGRAYTPRQARQAQRPAAAACLPNEFGTAPGLYARVKADGGHGACDVFCLPGPPGELRPMFRNLVAPRLTADPARGVTTRIAHVVGVPEADCVNRLGELCARDRVARGVPMVGVTASGGVLTLRVRYEGAAAPADVGAMLDETLQRVEGVLGDHVIRLEAGGDLAGVPALAWRVGTLLRARTPAGRLVTVESCTGGMLGEIITDVPGSSAYYAGGLVTYANEMKEAAGVPAALIAAHGAVSAPVAEHLAVAGLRAGARAGGTHALAITGVAGPGGGSAAKPVGTVYIALAQRGAEGGAGDSSEPHALPARCFQFTGERDDIRRRACTSALAMLYFQLRGREGGQPRLLWEMK